MSSAESQSKTSERPTKKDVAIVGGGIAGLTCALRLLQRGYQVTLYEEEETLGGDLSSKRRYGMYHDVYTHLFCDWYVNFWRIVEDDLKIKRDDAFEPRMSVKLLDDPSGPASPKSLDRGTGAGGQGALANSGGHNIPIYTDLKNPNTVRNILDNLLSGALSPPDMFLVGFAMLDLASQPFHRSILLEQQTVNGFLYSRPYATQDGADLHNTILNEIWCISSNDTSAAAYKEFISYVLGSRGLPFAWLLRGSLEERLIKPWQENLEKRKDFTIRKSVKVTAVEIDDDKVQLTLGEDKEKHANVVLAVPAPELARLVMAGSPGRSVVDRLPALSELQRLRTASILVVTLFFKEKLPNIPREHVGLARSQGYLTFIDISQLWSSLSAIKEQHTVLILAASDAYAYPSAKDEEWAHLMIEELARYLPAVKPGHTWGDSASNIDYSKSWPQNNRSHTLFLNDMSSEQVLLEPSYPELEQVFFAGDFCHNEVKMATVEAAVLSGIHAARAVQIRTEGKTDITVEPGVMFSAGELSAMKLALLPVAYFATAWAAANVALRNLANGETQTPEGTLTPLTTIGLIPLRYAADWVANLELLGVALLSRGSGPNTSGFTVQQGLRAAARGVVAAADYVCNLDSGRPADKTRGLAALLTNVLKAAITAAPPATPISVVPGQGDEALLRAPMSRASTFPASADQTMQSELSKVSELLRGSGRYRPRFEYVRRHRAKL